MSKNRRNQADSALKQFIFLLKYLLGSSSVGYVGASYMSGPDLSSAVDAWGKKYQQEEKNQTCDQYCDLVKMIRFGYKQDSD